MSMYRLLLMRGAAVAEQQAQSEGEGHGWSSDFDIVREVGLPHPAVLLKYLRIATFIRMTRKASLQWWRVRYAALHAKRSWLRSVRGDFIWLKLTTSTFSDMSVADVSEWYLMASSSPHLMLRAAKKACQGQFAITAAVMSHSYKDEALLAPVSLDAPSAWQCAECEYVGTSKRSLSLHVITTHGTLLPRIIVWTHRCARCAASFSGHSTVPSNMSSISRQSASAIFCSAGRSSARSRYRTSDARLLNTVRPL